MKTLLTTFILCILALPAMASDDKSVTVEFIWGIGGTTAHKGVVLRIGQDNTEAHVAHWFGPRSNTAVGFGLVGRTESDGQANDSFFNASGQVGLSYVFKTNSVFSTHLQPYFRVDGTANVATDGDVEVVLSYSRYGFLVAEQFGGLGLRINNRDNPVAESGMSQVDPPDGDESPDDDDSDDDDDGNSGHGNDEDGCDESNPGKSPNCES